MLALRRARSAVGAVSPRVLLSDQAQGGDRATSDSTERPMDQWVTAAAREAGSPSPIEALSRTTPEVTVWDMPSVLFLMHKWVLLFRTNQFAE